MRGLGQAVTGLQFSPPTGAGPLTYSNVSQEFIFTGKQVK
jgi:hypothetical protein